MNHAIGQHALAETIDALWDFQCVHAFYGSHFSNRIETFLRRFKLSAHLTSYNVTILLPHDLRQYRAALRHARFLTCDYRSADAYRRKYGKKADANTTVVTFVPEASIANLADLRDVLHTLRMTPFLCGGTLLGKP